MNPLFILMAFAVVVAQFALPLRLAFVPLLIAVSQFQNVPVLNLGASLSVCKLVILAGLLRAWSARTLNWSARQPLDVLVGVWAAWMALSGFAHHPEDHNPITIRLSVIYDVAGAYVYARSFIRDREDFLRFCRALAVVVVPLALMVLLEKGTLQNWYGVLSGGVDEAGVREGRVRTSGPFSHAILLGTFGATSIPLLASLWRRYRRWAVAGGMACMVIVYCSASSGPIMTLLSAMLGLGLWRWRASVGRIRKLVILGFVALQLMMQAPVWYLMARVDLAGGSTGWHRAELITAALKHLNEWWLVGTDYTRHWIAYGVLWSQYHIDITNHYINQGVVGGLPLMVCFVLILFKAFQALGRGMQPLREVSDPEEFTLWCVGAALLAHCFAFFSISYFDQSNVIFSMTVGSVIGLCEVATGAGAEWREPPLEEEPVSEDSGATEPEPGAAQP